MSNFEEKNVVDAAEFILRGNNGEVQGRLRATDRGPEFTLFDTHGRKRASIEVIHHPYLALFDGTGHARVQMTILHNGPVIWISDGKRKQRAVLATVGEETHLSLYGSSVPAGVSLSISGDSPTLTLREGSGDTISVAQFIVKGHTIQRRKSVKSTEERNSLIYDHKETDDELS
jgi:hypothetical protein